MYVTENMCAAPCVVLCFWNMKNIPECQNEVSEHTPAYVPVCTHTHLHTHRNTIYHLKKKSEG